MTTATAAESVPLPCAIYSTDVALIERQSISKSLLTLSPELEGISSHQSSSTDTGDRSLTAGPSLVGLPAGKSPDDDLYNESDLVTPCQGLLKKYNDYHQSDHTLHFGDHPQLKEIANANFKALIGAPQGHGVGPDSSSTGGSDHTWHGSIPSQMPSNATSPLTSFEAEQTSSQMSISNAMPAPSLSGNKKTQYKKTKLCPWHRDGKCFMGAACNYAHSREELRPKPDLSKTKLCPELAKGRQCTHEGCRFAHDFVELRATSAFFKTRICKFWQRGICPAGAECRHAHGREDLRPSVGGMIDIPAAPLSARQPPKRPLLSSSCSINSDGAWTVDDSQLQPVIAPPASSIPSPSFLSTTASTPSPAAQPPLGLETAQLAQTLRQCAALLTENTNNGLTRQATPVMPDEGSLSVLRSWIAQEVEKQVQLRQEQAAAANRGPPPTPPAPPRLITPECFNETPMKSRENPSFLPSNLIQGLNLSPSQASLPPTFNPMEHGWLSPKAPDHCGGGSTPAFASAVRGLFNSVATSPPPPGLLPTDWMSSTWQSHAGSTSTSHLGF